jgi:hypothetical protein
MSDSPPKRSSSPSGKAAPRASEDDGEVTRTQVDKGRSSALAELDQLDDARLSPPGPKLAARLSESGKQTAPRKPEPKAKPQPSILISKSMVMEIPTEVEMKALRVETPTAPPRPSRGGPSPKVQVRLDEATAPQPTLRRSRSRRRLWVVGALACLGLGLGIGLGYKVLVGRGAGDEAAGHLQAGRTAIAAADWATAQRELQLAGKDAQLAEQVEVQLTSLRKAQATAVLLAAQKKLAAGDRAGAQKDLAALEALSPAQAAVLQKALSTAP